MQKIIHRAIFKNSFRQGKIRHKSGVVMKKKVTCIVAAGGSGTRMGASTNKLFLKINDIPVIVHTLMALNNCDEIDEIIISAKEDEVFYISELVSVFSISKVKTIVKGGKTRGESVLSASREVSADADFVMIHDGARPLVSDKILKTSVNAAKQYGAAACGVKPKCTLKSIDSGFISCTIDREKTVEIQTPQIFKKELFDAMYSHDLETINRATDDCILAELSGNRIFVTEGSYENIKITTPEDIEIAELLLGRD